MTHSLLEMLSHQNKNVGRRHITHGGDATLSACERADDAQWSISKHFSMLKCKAERPKIRSVVYAAALNKADHSIGRYTTARYPHQDLAPHLALSNQSVPISSDLQPPPPKNSHTHQNITGGSKVDTAFSATLVLA